MRNKMLEGYCIRMPTEPELGITAPCKLWCTLLALFTSCMSNVEHLLSKYHATTQCD